MRILLTTLLLCAALTSFSQTKMIAFKSHSGTAENFRVALDKGLFDMDNSNFGLPSKERYSTLLDSVIFVNDTTSILVVSQQISSSPYDAAHTSIGFTTRDTVYRHPLFSQRHSLDSIRRVLKTDHVYQNHPENAIFIGYDNKKKKKTRQSEVLLVIPKTEPGNPGATVTVSPQTNFPFDNTAVMMLSFVLGVAMLAGFAAWKYSTSTQKTQLQAGN